MPICVTTKSPTVIVPPNAASACPIKLNAIATAVK